MKLWGKRRSERDLVIKLNTGGGKTLVGLLIGQALVNELHRPVLYLCPTRQLVQQTLEKAQEVSIAAIGYGVGPGSLPTTFLNAESLLVATYSALFHGRSKFGVHGSGQEPIGLGAIICDDAHVALTTIRDQFTLAVSREKHQELYNDLCTRFRVDFSSGRIGTFDDIVERREQGVLELPYTAWAVKSSAIRELLSRSYADESKYHLPLLRNHFDCCHAFITSREFSITPLLPLVDQLPSFEECKRRVYMSATIADDSSIIRTFGASERSIKQPIIPETLAGVGERMVLAPALMKFGSDKDRQVAQSVVKGISQKVNVVILVPSEAAGEQWTKFGTIVAGDKVDDAIAALHSGSPRGPYVFANRYDGIDLLGDACRLLVLDGLPKAASAYDSFRSEALRASSSLNLGLAQKVEQGLGRATRGAGDYCAVLLVGHELTAWITRHESLALMTPSTRAQVNIGHEISKEIASESDLGYTVEQCLNRDADWVKYHAQTLADRAETPQADLVAIAAAAAEREYARAFAHHLYTEAMNIAQQYAAAHSEDRRLRGWFLQLAARAAHYAQKIAQAEELQRQAFRANAILWCPASAAANLYTPTLQVGRQAEVILTQIGRFALPNGHLQDFEDAISCLTPTATSNQFEQSMKRLGELLGFHAERPEQDCGEGPDVLWITADQVGLIIECKSNKQMGSSLTKSEHGQLLVSENWFHQHYPNHKAVRIVMHPTSTASPQASAQGTYALTFGSLAKLTVALKGTLREVCLSVASNEKRLALCDKLLKENLLTPPALESAYLTEFKAG